MSPVMSALTVGGLTTLGRWANDKGLTIDTIVGIMGVAIILTFIQQANEDLASAFGALIIVAVAIVQLPAILAKTGLVK